MCFFWGSSHTYRFLNPQITDEIFGCNTFNGGTALQHIDASYALLKETIKSNDIKQVYLERYWMIALAIDNKERTDLTSTYVVSDYMKPSLNKLLFLLQASSSDYYINSFLPARRYHENIFDLNYMSDVVQNKQNKSYLNFEPTGNYVGKGFVTNEKVMSDKYIWNTFAFSSIPTNYFSKDWKEQLDDVITLCKDKGIKLTLFTSPSMEWTVAGVGNYDVYHDYIQSIADAAGINYFDFNLLDSNIFDTKDRQYYEDEGHVNSNGANAFSHIFADVCCGNIDCENVTYDKTVNKFYSDEPFIYGLARNMNQKDENHVDGRIISNRLDGMNYKVAVIRDGKNEETVKEYSEGTKFSINGEYDKIVVYWNGDELDGEERYVFDEK